MTRDANVDLPRVGVVYAPEGAATLSDIRMASKGLCDIVILMRESVASKNPNLVTVASRLFPVYIRRICSDFEDLVARLGLTNVITYNDGELEVADNLAALVTDVGPGSLVWDKLVQRSILLDRGITRIRARRVDSYDDFARAITDVGVPGLLKPRRGADGLGIWLANSNCDLKKIADRIETWSGLMYEQQICGAPHPSGVPHLADFVSVETVSDDRSNHHVVAIFDKLPMQTYQGRDELTSAGHTTGDVFPTQLPLEWSKMVERYTCNVLEALGVRSRVTHTELMLTASGPELIEVNGRVGGHLDRLLRLAGKPDLVRMNLAAAIGAEVSLESYEDTGPAVMGYFPRFHPSVLHVSSQPSKSDLRVIPEVVGVDEVSGARDPDLNGRRIVNCTLRASDHTALSQGLAAVIFHTMILYSQEIGEHDEWFRQMLRVLPNIDGGRF